MIHSFNELIDKEIQRTVLEQILPRDLRDAVGQGLLHVHSLGSYLEPDVVTLELRQLPSRDPFLHATGLWRHMKRSANRGTAVVLGSFVSDLGHVWRGFGNTRNLESYLHEFFCCVSEEPRVRLTINLGDDDEDAFIDVAGVVLKVLGQGPTYLEPQLVFRVRRGVNLEPDTKSHRLLLDALELARTRKGISFALLDSPMNSQWLGLQCFDGFGLRIEPQVLDLYSGTRGQVIPARVSLNVPLAFSFGRDFLLTTVDLAARLLAHRLELISQGSPTSYCTDFCPLVMNLSGIRELEGQEIFTLLEELKFRVRKLQQHYGLNFILSSTAEKVPFAFASQRGRMQALDAVSAASLEPFLPGGHCMVIPSGPHHSCEELYKQLQDMERAGVSFVSFDVEDVRCASCHLSVAAVGACPVCGGQRRRRVYEEGGRLEEETYG